METCSECLKKFMTKKNLREHEETHASSSSSSSPLSSKQCRVPVQLKKITSAFKNRIASYLYKNEKEEIIYPQEFFSQIKDEIIRILSDAQREHISFKYNMELNGEYIKIHEDDLIVQKITHRSKMEFVTLSDDLEETFKKQSLEICSRMSEFQERDSGWTLICIKDLQININKSSFVRGSRYIPLPEWIEKKKACVNIKNHDDYCFKWSIIAFFSTCKQDVLNNVTNIESEEISIGGKLLHFNRLEFPMKLRDIKKFEDLNSTISINVFGCEERSLVGPYYLTQGEKEWHINLLLLTNKDCFHFVLISDMSR